MSSDKYAIPLDVNGMVLCVVVVVVLSLISSLSLALPRFMLHLTLLEYFEDAQKDEVFDHSHSADLKWGDSTESLLKTKPIESFIVFVKDGDNAQTLAPAWLSLSGIACISFLILGNFITSSHLIWHIITYKYISKKLIGARIWCGIMLSCILFQLLTSRYIGVFVNGRWNADLLGGTSSNPISFWSGAGLIDFFYWPIINELVQYATVYSVCIAQLLLSLIICMIIVGRKYFAGSAIQTLQASLRGRDAQ